MKMILPILLVLAVLAGGAGAGMFLRPEHPEPECHAEPCPELADEGAGEEHHAKTEFVKLTRQFVVPVVDQERVRALVVATVSIEVTEGLSDAVFAQEPKLRDSFLQAMLHHANTGGFDGQFTARPAMDDLRGKLLEAAQAVFGDDATAVLITDISRQDIES